MYQHPIQYPPFLVKTTTRSGASGRNVLWRQKINVNLLSKYQLLPAEVRETEQTQVPYWAWLIIIVRCSSASCPSWQLVASLSTFQVKILISPLYVLRANSLERGHFKISLVWEIFCSLFSTVPTVCTTPPIPPRGRLSISVTIIFDHFYYIK